MMQKTVKEEDVVLLETKFWKVALFQNQSYLGRCVVVLKRETGEMSDLTLDEWMDFYDIVKKLEISFKKAFNAAMFNWTCLMNNAYQVKNPKPRVHWHFRPRRYNQDVYFAGEKFQDLEFAHHYSRERIQIVSKEMLQKISEEVMKYL